MSDTSMFRPRFPARIFHVRVPMAGDECVDSLLGAQFPGAKRFRFPGDASTMRWFESLPLEERASHQVLTGHGHMGIHEHVPGSGAYVTLLRDPVERVAAHYRHVLSDKVHYLHARVAENNIPLREYASLGLTPELDQGQLRALLPASERGTPVGGLTRAHLDLALVTIRHVVAAFGIAELPAESIAHFRSVFGWSARPAAHLLKPPPMFAMSDEDRRALEEACALDMEFYRAARSLFESRSVSIQDDARALAAAAAAAVPIAIVEPKPAPPSPTVFHVTHWKAGSQWVRAVLESAFRGRIVPMKRDMSHITADPITPGGIYTPVYLTRRSFETAVPRTCDPRPFVVIRDLRDTLVSWYFSLKVSHGDDYGPVREFRKTLNDLSFEDGMRFLIEDRAPEIASLNHIADIQRSWLESDALVVRYEDLVADEHAGYRRIFEHCGLEIDPDEFRQAVGKNSFEVRAGRKRGQEDAASHFRKGIAGDWKQRFTPELASAFKECYGRILIETGYEQGPDWSHAPTALLR